MDITAILKELYQERDLLDQAILTLERAQAGTYHRRGRPPKWLERARAEKQDQPEANGAAKAAAKQPVSKRKVTPHSSRNVAANPAPAETRDGFVEKAIRANALTS